MYEADIVIMDSGVFCGTEEIDKDIVSFSFFGNNICITEDLEDDIGHGTAVYSIIKKISPLSKILNIKLFYNAKVIEEKDLLEALKFVKEHVKCKIINLSCGIRYCHNKRELEEICLQLYQQGVIIISAFDNAGCCSFPAAFRSVIGVDGSDCCKKTFDFEFVEGEMVNVRAKGGFQRVRWRKGESIILGGSSFACAYVTAYIANLYLQHKKNLSFDVAMNELKKTALQIYKIDNYVNAHTGVSAKIAIKSAAIFPFNKEMHSVIRYVDGLKYTIKTVYDVRQTGRVGASTNRLLNITDTRKSYIIKDIRDINYNEIDYIIIGHLEEVNRILGKDIRREIVESCIENGVNIYSFDSLEYCSDIIEHASISIFWPSVCKWNVPQNTFGKLYGITKPVVGFFGTSSKQGKFTLQVAMKQLLEEVGLKVGAIGTEPHALLFGMDFVYPMGYNSAVYISDYEAIMLLNKMCYELSDENDIIMVGSQANTIPYNCMNISSFHSRQSSFLIGTRPDVIVLCANIEDDMDYIQNTVKYLEGIIDCKVIAIVLSPLRLRSDWRGLFDTKSLISDEEYAAFLITIKERLGINVHRLGDEKDMVALRDSVLAYFSV